ncbi:hypothetical protein SE17_21920 [Kouleothrix aurantiaca]|uniref:Uncharacterized protein n=1 Tax=Kouleothrix aurantiaca TaxID=186479 RepID=A0A0P9DED6_9CHLR|nr:hypothetical protein SE17_21920 [Kouleothrix aurantiaca]
MLVQVTEILAACQQIDPEMRAGPLTQAALATALTEARSYQTQIQDLELQLITMRDKRDASLSELWDVVKRVRSTVKGMYGDDSVEYEMVGGTRLSDRRRAARRPTE